MSEHAVGEYRRVYPSRIEPGRSFSTFDAARQWDRDLALAEIVGLTDRDFEAAFERRNDRVARALKVLAEETDLMPEFEEAAA
jgi:hypothetical protein